MKSHEWRQGIVTVNIVRSLDEWFKTRRTLYTLKKKYKKLDENYLEEINHLDDL